MMSEPSSIGRIAVPQPHHCPPSEIGQDPRRGCSRRARPRPVPYVRSRTRGRRSARHAQLSVAMHEHAITQVVADQLAVERDRARLGAVRAADRARQSRKQSPSTCVPGLEAKAAVDRRHDRSVDPWPASASSPASMATSPTSLTRASPVRRVVLAPIIEGNQRIGLLGSQLGFNATGVCAEQQTRPPCASSAASTGRARIVLGTLGSLQIV